LFLAKPPFWLLFAGILQLKAVGGVLPRLLAHGDGMEFFIALSTCRSPE
jgi:hypothetical protein